MFGILGDLAGLGVAVVGTTVAGTAEVVGAVTGLDPITDVVSEVTMGVTETVVDVATM